MSCHARQIVLERPGCQHCTSAQSGAAQGSLETLCGGSESGAVELKMSSPELLNQVGPWALHCLKSMSHLKWLTMGLPKNKWGIATTSRASGATATGEVRAMASCFHCREHSHHVFAWRWGDHNHRHLDQCPSHEGCYNGHFRIFSPIGLLPFSTKFPLLLLLDRKGW